MVDAKNIFIHENISSHENRVNLALFSMMQQDFFRQWFLGKLDLSTDAVAYPPVNYRGRRPDLKVELDGETLAWIEVELGTNVAQLEDYRAIFSAPVKAVWGRTEDGGDLSLEEIGQFLESRTGLSPQVDVNVTHLNKLIREGLTGKSTDSRTNVSEETRQLPLVVALTESLGNNLVPGTGAINDGQVGADTVGPNGISLRVKRRDASGTVALFSITAGSHIIFPSRKKLKRCLPGHKNEIGEYLQVAIDLGCNVDVEQDNARPRLSLQEYGDRLIGRVDEFAGHLLALASP